jgi:DNA-binding transcriptional LysR family regulator
MDADQLALLRELADRGSVGAVATALHKSPSAVSQQLRTLQRQAGVALVERRGRGVELTNAGRALAESAVDVAVAVARAEAVVRSYVEGTTAVVRLATFPSAAELLVPGLLRRMRSHPDIRIDATDRDVAEDEFAPLAADFDLVLGHRSEGSPPPTRERVTVVPILREPLDVAVPLDHPLADRGRVTVGEVIGDDWISVPRDFPFDRVLVGLSRSGMSPNVVFRSIHLPLVENMVAAGHGIALVPRHTSRHRSAGRFRLLELADVPAARHIEAILRPERAAHPAVATVLEELRAEAALVDA